MDSSILDGQLHHHLIPHSEQSTAYGISSPLSDHPQTLLADKFPPPLIDPSTFWHHPSPLPPLPQDNQMTLSIPYPQLPVYSYEPQEEYVPQGGREKRHRCQLCNKRFDRPSTLKKHMLVHTGEKAWACEICGRRFSVSSNLNRHSRRCKEKWAKPYSSATSDTPPPSATSGPSEFADSPPASSSPSSSSEASDPYSPSSPHLTDQRQSAPGPVKYEIDDGPRSHDQRHGAGKIQRKRRRSPAAEPWIPASLVHFKLDPTSTYVSTPLPAVVPSTSEERNSYADTPSQAYHPSCWTGHLVGPSYIPKAEEMSQGRYCGKLLVF